MMLTILLIIIYILPMAYCAIHLSLLFYTDHKNGHKLETRDVLTCLMLTICPLINVYLAGKLLEEINNDYYTD